MATGSILLDINVGELTLLGGRRQSDVAHMAVLPAPRRAQGRRRHETIFVFLDLGGGGAGKLARSMLERLGQAYWRGSGAVTSALRNAIAAANALLLDENRLLPVEQRRRAGLVCIVLRENHFYLAQVGPTRALLAQDGQVTQFPPGPRGELPLGVSRGLDIYFTHGFLNAGDVLLLTGSSWSEGLPPDALPAALSAQASVQDVMRTLERQAGLTPVSALIVGCASPDVAQPSSGAQPSGGSSAGAVSSRPASTTEPQASKSLAAARSALSGARRAPPPQEPDLDEQPQGGWRPPNPLASLAMDAEQVERVRHRLRQAGESLMYGARTLLTRVLPELEPAPHRRRRGREGAAENMPMMVGIAIGIPLVVAFIVATFYLQRNASARRESLTERAGEALLAARQSGGDEARQRWDEALQAAQDALQVAPKDDELLAWRNESRGALDALDGVQRPELTLLDDYGPGQGRRLAVTRLQVYVLDTQQDQVTQHMLSEARQSAGNGQHTLVAYRGFSVGDAQIGELRDVVWLEAGGAWVNDSLLILTDDNQLLKYSLSWGLSWVRLDTGLAHVNASVLRPFEGKLYVLDPGQSQVWRFPLSGEGFGPPEGYFSAAAPDLSSAVDMTIDGAVYILLGDGRIYKFFGSEAQPYQPSGLPQPFSRPVALASEGDALGGALYVADAGTQSIIALNKNGEFIHQIKAEGNALADLQALTIEQSSRTLYALAGGRLYALALPALPGASD
jgi:hypothetical protein